MATLETQKHKERLWCVFELAAFLKSKKMTSGKKTLIVRPLFLGPISIAIFALCFVVGLPLTTVSFANYTIDMVLVMTPGLLAGLVVAYPTVACRLFAKQADFFFFSDWNLNQTYYSCSFSFPTSILLIQRSLVLESFPF